jgi:hypothetical protein
MAIAANFNPAAYFFAKSDFAAYTESAKTIIPKNTNAIMLNVI